MALNQQQFAVVKKIFQENIDSLILTLGKNVILYFGETITNVNTDFDDPLRHDQSKKPDFKQTNTDSAPTKVMNTKVIKALIKDNPKEFLSFGIRVDNAQAIVRLKTFLTDVNDLKRCLYIQVHSDVGQVVNAKYRLIREPVPTGLQEDRYAISYWTHV